ncbi:MAG: bifunctional 5,10-methylenetetrahydrofolate dehydrogenase/5,10-methenyltetrahydrofolate cyclohydrolase [Candidatus Dojkabacteria bacterium]
MILLDGKKLSEKILSTLKLRILESIENGNRVPRLDIILVGEDFASKKYVGLKMDRACEIGIKVVLHEFDTNVSTEELLSLVRELNQDSRVDGVMVQLPLPDGIDTSVVLDSIWVEKDVDGLTSSNLGKLFKNDNTAIIPATARGILELLKEYKINIDGAKAVVVGRSNIVGLPTSAVLQNNNATVTVCHSHTKQLKKITTQADILVVAIGKGEYIDKDFVKENSVVIDVGININDKEKMVGDVKFNSVSKVASFLSPIPGGVGPMTVASLILNVVEIYERNVKRF